MDNKTPILCRRIHQVYVEGEWVPVANSNGTYDEHLTNEEYYRMVSLEWIRLFQAMGSAQEVQFNNRGKIDFLASYVPHSLDERIAHYFLFEG